MRNKHFRVVSFLDTVLFCNYQSIHSNYAINSLDSSNQHESMGRSNMGWQEALFEYTPQRILSYIVRVSVTVCAKGCQEV
jgi:hypothetical protein